MRLPRVYPIVDGAAWVGRFAPLGVRLLQLRIKERSATEVRAEVRAARALCAAAGLQLIVNDYWEIALAEGCDFVHLGQGDLAGADLPALRRAGVRLGISTHDNAELERALCNQPDYVALGPIYPTLLKAMPWKPQGLARIGEWKRRIGAIPLVAIGGLTLERLADVFAAGADVAAVVTDIVRNVDPEARTRAWLATAARAA
jgi:thiamine-phosphate pyrophosphorylase